MQLTLMALSGVLLVSSLASVLVHGADLQQMGLGSGGGAGGQALPSRTKLLSQREWEPVKAARVKREDAATVTDHQSSDVHQDLHDDVHGILMGVPDGRCDDGHVNLTRDWDNSPVNYTCVTQKFYAVNASAPSIVEFEPEPANNIPGHLCLDTSIAYDRVVPTFGNHRPLWPLYGEYKFLPIQRWLHSLEHGAIVMLYHPCADPDEVERLRKLVNGCIWRHVITPYNLLDEKYPMVLVAWGVKIYISKVDSDIVRAFIRERYGHGWEGYDLRDGQFDYLLEIPSVPPVGSDKKDSVICPNQ